MEGRTDSYLIKRLDISLVLLLIVFNPTTGDALHAVHFASDGRGDHAQGAGTTRGREGGRDGGREGGLGFIFSVLPGRENGEREGGKVSGKASTIKSILLTKCPLLLFF